MRTGAVYAALQFLAMLADQKWPFEQFRTALMDNDPEGRWQILNASLNAIKRAVYDWRK